MIRFKKATGLMGHQHKSKPVTEEDKAMSQRHKNNRANAKTISKDNDQDLHESNSYNENHAREHIEQIKKNNRQILDKSKRNTAVNGLLSQVSHKGCNCGDK